MRTAEDILKDKNDKIVSVPENTIIKDVITRMVKHKIGAMLVKKEDQFIGIWTERDLLFHCLDPKFDLEKSVVDDYMDTNIVSAPADMSIEKLFDKFLGLYVRHIIVVRETSYLGLLSIGDVVRAMLSEKNKEIRKLNQIAGWEYYENWGWHHQHQQKDEQHKKESSDNE